MAHPCDCKKFYVCTGLPVTTEAGETMYYPNLSECYGDLVFSPTMKICTTVDKVPECQHTTTSPKSRATGELQSEYSCFNQFHKVIHYFKSDLLSALVQKKNTF